MFLKLSCFRSLYALKQEPLSLSQWWFLWPVSFMTTAYRARDYPDHLVPFLQLRGRQSEGCTVGHQQQESSIWATWMPKEPGTTVVILEL